MLCTCVNVRVHTHTCTAGLTVELTDYALHEMDKSRHSYFGCTLYVAVNTVLMCEYYCTKDKR